MPLGLLKVLEISFWEKEKASASAECVSWTKILHSPENLDHLTDETEADSDHQWWAGVHFYLECGEVHTLGLLFQLQLHLRTPKTDLGLCRISLSLF